MGAFDRNTAKVTGYRGKDTCVRTEDMSAAVTTQDCFKSPGAKKDKDSPLWPC